MIWEVPNAFPDDLCDSLVEIFENNPEHRYKGLIGNGIVDKSVKDSEDFKLSGKNSDECVELDNRVFEIVNKQNAEYSKIHAKAFWEEESDRERIKNRNMSDTGFQIQKTVKDGGYIWHSDFDVNPVIDTLPFMTNNAYPIMGTKERIYTFLYYLTDDFEGGRTQFYFNGEIHSVIPEKGKGIWFPSTHQYIHRGEIVTSGEKYVITGWVFHETSRSTTGTYCLSEHLREKHGEPNMIFSYNP